MDVRQPPLLFYNLLKINLQGIYSYLVKEL